MRHKLVDTRHGCQYLRLNPAQSNPVTKDHALQRTHRAQIRRTEEHGGIDFRRTAHVDGEGALAFQRIHRAVAKVIASDETAHTVGDHIDSQSRIIIVATNLFDKRVKTLRGRYIVLPPVVCEYVIPPHSRIGVYAEFPLNETP